MAYVICIFSGPNLPSASFSNGPRLVENGDKDGAIITLGKKIYEISCLLFAKKYIANAT